MIYQGSFRVNRTPLKRKKSLRQSYAEKMRAKGCFRNGLTGNSRLKSNGGALKRKTKLRQASPKRRKALSLYSSLRTAFLIANPVCQALFVNGVRQLLCKVEAVDVHHKAGRGPNLNRVDTWMAVCRYCHNAIHANPKAAREAGLLI